MQQNSSGGDVKNRPKKTKESKMPSLFDKIPIVEFENIEKMPDKALVAIQVSMEVTQETFVIASRQPHFDKWLITELHQHDFDISPEGPEIIRIDDPINYNVLFRQTRFLHPDDPLVRRIVEEKTSKPKMVDIKVKAELKTNSDSEKDTKSFKTIDDLRAWLRNGKAG